ncbi:MAG: hypothetical protein ABW221_07675 [Vicinamibacteria bacterium]
MTETLVVLAVGMVLLLARRRCALEASRLHERLVSVPLDSRASEIGFGMGGCAYIAVGLLALLSRF